MRYLFKVWLFPFFLFGENSFIGKWDKVEWGDFLETVVVIGKYLFRMGTENNGGSLGIRTGIKHA